MEADGTLDGTLVGQPLPKKLGLTDGSDKKVGVTSREGRQLGLHEGLAVGIRDGIPLEPEG